MPSITYEQHLMQAMLIAEGRARRMKDETLRTFEILAENVEQTQQAWYAANDVFRTACLKKDYPQEEFDAALDAEQDASAAYEAAERRLKRFLRTAKQESQP